jgi:hypothetical protein
MGLDLPVDEIRDHARRSALAGRDSQKLTLITEPIFEPLPPIGGKRGTKDYGLSAAIVALKKKPMQWARVATFRDKKRASSVTISINRGKNPYFGEDFAARIRTFGDGTCVLYMRFVGDAPDQEPPK